MDPGDIVLEDVCPICGNNLAMPLHNPFHKLIMIKCDVCNWSLNGKDGRVLQKLLGMKNVPTVIEQYEQKKQLA